MSAIGSFALIGWKLSSESAQRSAATALSVTIAGSLALLLALLYLSELRGTTSLSVLTSPWPEVANFPNISLIIFALFIAGMTKSALFPFHFWLPQAMVAPTPVSAYLHSASLVNLGVFLFGLFAPLLKPLLLWHVGLSGIGLLTFAIGSILALLQTDMKKGLAYTTLSALGLVTTMFGLRAESVYYAATLLLISHALYKSALFMSVGILSRGMQSQDLLHTHSLWKLQRSLVLLMGVACFSMVGLPPTLGFVSKEMALHFLLGPFATANAQWFTWICASVGMLCTSAFAFLLLLKPALPSSETMPKSFNFSKVMQWSVWPLPLAGFATWGFIWSEFWNAPLLIWSGACFVGGFVLSLLLMRPKSPWMKDRPPWFHKISGAKWWEELREHSIPLLFDRLHTLIENQMSKAGYPLLFIMFAVLIFTQTPSFHWLWDFSTHTDRHLFLSIAIFTIGILSCTLLLIPSAKSLIFAVSGIGFIVSFCYAAFGAPDLLLTQILVEVATLILLIGGWFLARPKLTAIASSQSFHKGILKWVISFATAFVAVSAFLMANADLSLQKFSSNFFFENAQRAFGSNIVNLVIVDFRGLDTLGEITVLALAYFGIRGFVSRLPKSGDVPLSSSHEPRSQWTGPLFRPIAIMLLLFSLWLFWRGHDLPGGGFIGGLMAAFVLLSWRLVYRRKINFTPLAAGGLLLAYAIALIPLWSHRSFFESFLTPVGPSSLLFDAGVFLTVAGSISGILDEVYSMIFGFRKRGEHVR